MTLFMLPSLTLVIGLRGLNRLCRAVSQLIVLVLPVLSLCYIRVHVHVLPRYMTCRATMYLGTGTRVLVEKSCQVNSSRDDRLGPGRGTTCSLGRNEISPLSVITYRNLYFNGLVSPSSIPLYCLVSLYNSTG